MKRKTLYSHFYVGFLTVGMAVVAGYQLIGESRDFGNYIAFFKYISSERGSLSFASRFEPGFTLLVFGLTRLTQDGNLIYSGIVGMMVALKLLAISMRQSLVVVFAVFTFYYLTRYFILFEMTVLRAACAFSIAFVVFFAKELERYRVTDILLLLLACTFHYSAIVFFYVYAFRKVTRLTVLIAASALYVAVRLSYEIFLNWAPEYIAVFRSYGDFTRATAFSVPYTIDLLYLSAMLTQWKRFDSVMRSCVFGISVGAALHFSLLEFSQIGGRFRELLSVFILIFVIRAATSNAKLVRELSFIYVIFSGMLNLYVYVVHDPLLS